MRRNPSPPRTLGDATPPTLWEQSHEGLLIADLLARNGPPRRRPIAQDASARTVQYHSQDIVSIHAKLKFTTLIEVPATEKIMEAATGDKDFWVVDVVGNFCFVHPAKPGISSNLNLITDKGNIYSFTLQDVSGTSEAPDLKVLVDPADRSSIVAANGPTTILFPPPNWNSPGSNSLRYSPRLSKPSMNTKAHIRSSSSSITRSTPMKRPSIFSRSITTTSSPTLRRMRRRNSRSTR